MPPTHRFTAITLLLLAMLAGCGGSGGSSGSSTVGSTSNGQMADLSKACPTPSATVTAPVGGLGTVVDAVITAEMAAKGIPGMSVTIARKGTVLYSNGYGYADLSGCRPAQAGTVYQIGSVTKQFTAAAILQLQATGLLGIDDKVSRYLPAYGFDDRLTLRMLLNQTSGLPDYVEFADGLSSVQHIAQADVLAGIAAAHLLFAPGSAYAYSNSNYFILASVIEAVSKTSYADYLASHIFQPVGLVHTSYAAPRGGEAAQPYTRTRPLVPGTPGLAAGIALDPSALFGAGALWSTTEDLAKWDAAVLSGTVIPSDLLALALTPPASIPVFQGNATTDYAMGWVRDDLGGHTLAWHNGRTYAYSAFNGVFLDDGISVSILANIDLHDDPVLLGLALTLLRKICNGQQAALSC